MNEFQNEGNLVPNEVAVKWMDYERLKAEAEDGEKYLERELKLAAMLSRHPSENVVKFFGKTELCYQHVHQIGLIMELCSGTLQSIIDDGRQWGEQDLGIVSWNILCGIDHLHKLGLLHRYERGRDKSQLCNRFTI